MTDRKPTPDPHPLETDTETCLKSCLETIKAHDKYWKKQAARIYELKLQLTDPLFVQINHLRQAFRFYVIPVLETVLEKPTAEQEAFVQFFPFLFAADGMKQFLKHYYAVIEKAPNDWVFEDRDAYRQDELLLYDLYKVKRTMNGIIALLKDLDQRRTSFPSMFTKERQIEVLKNMNSALFMAFKLCLKPEYQVDVYQTIRLDYLDSETTEERRRKGILFGRPNQPDSSPYRRYFLHLLFRTGIKTMIKNQPTVIQYHLVAFEQLMEEYFGHFLKADNEDLNALHVYHNLHIMGKTLTSSLIDDPDPDRIIYEEIDDIRTLL
jgi:hypothetical protein